MHFEYKMAMFSILHFPKPMIFSGGPWPGYDPYDMWYKIGIY
jgi:hypothetical protein